MKIADRFSRNRLGSLLRFRLGRVRNQLRLPALWPHKVLAVRLGFGTLPDFVIIGAQKCGTKSLYNYLSRHPQVRAARRKEVHYFDLNFTKSVSWYESYFPLSGGQPRSFKTGEASPYYIFHPHAASRIANVLPDVRLIALLRNPVDRAYSHYQHSVKFGYEKLSFEDALQRESEVLPVEIQRMESDPEYNSFAHRHYSYVARGLYADQLERWLAVTDRERLLPLISERLFLDPGSVFDEVLRFLELGPWGPDSWPVLNPGTYDDRMNPETRQRLQTLFLPHNERLARMTGLDVSGWT